MTSARPWVASYPVGVEADMAPLAHANIPAMLRQAAATYGGQSAFTVSLPNGADASLTFAEVDRLSDWFAAYLKLELKLQPGDRVAIQMPNSFGYVVAAFGILKAGCILVNVNPLYTAQETHHQIEDSGARVLVLIDMFADRLGPETRERLDQVVLASVVDFFPTMKRALIEFVLGRVKKQVPAAGFAHIRLRHAVAEGAERMADDAGGIAAFADDLTHDTAAALQYTGGTTGVAKGAVLTHGNILAALSQSLNFFSEHIEPGKELCLTVLPLYHIFAFTLNLLGMFQSGARNILIPSPRPLSNLKPAFQKYPITWTNGVNALFNALCNEDWFTAAPPKHLKAVLAGGMALHADVARRWEALTGSPIVEGYGLSETSAVLTVTPIHESGRRNTIGIPLPGTDIRLVADDGTPVSVGEPGELLARGPQIMKSYWNRPEEAAETLDDGWFATGDIAVMDEDGFFSIVDRKKDMIIVSGFNVFPNEVEECIAKMAGVTEAAVIGVKDESTGEAVKAFVVKNDADLSDKAIRDYCRQHLTAYKIPKIIEFRDNLPKSPVGKILRKDLKAEHA